MKVYKINLSELSVIQKAVAALGSLAEHPAIPPQVALTARKRAEDATEAINDVLTKSQIDNCRETAECAANP